MTLTNKTQKGKCECGRTRPLFGKPGETPRWCSKCPTRPKDTVDLKHPKCQCGRGRPSFGNLEDKIARWCAQCPMKPIDAVSIWGKKCQCGCASPSFGDIEDKIARWCAQCPMKPGNAVSLFGKKCQCGRVSPSFGNLEDKIARWCAQCPMKPGNAVSLSGKKCQCGRGRASFGHLGDRIPQWCAQCPTKPVGSVNVSNAKCICGRAKPSFGLLGDKGARWCKGCPTKPENAINITARRCLCGKAWPTFGKLGDSIPKWCKNCPSRPNDAIDISHKKCVCGASTPSFGCVGDTSPTWCKRCPTKPENAMNIKAKKCDLCDLIPKYGIPGHFQSRCKNHSTPGMISRPRVYCCEVGCKDAATHGILGGRALRCESHALAEDSDLVRKLCNKCNLLDVVDINGHCSTCDPDNFKAVRLRFQNEIKRVLDADPELCGYTSYDKTIFSGKYGKERPDWVYDLPHMILILECDENQHRDRNEWCECARTVNIASSYQSNALISSSQSKTVIFLRYNPHAYLDSRERTANPKFGQRMTELKKWILYFKKHTDLELPPLGWCSLYFDGHDQKVPTINPVDAL